MKTALCISGEMRSYRETFGELKKNIIDVLNPDVYIYTWDTIGGTWKNRCQINKYNKYFIDDFKVAPAGEDLKRDLETLYKPKKLVLETFKEEYKDKIKEVRSPQQLLQDADKARWSQYNLPMFYTLYECNEMKKQHEKENDFKYDLVIKARTDIRFPLIPDSILGHLKDLWYYPRDHNEGHTVSDKFAFSSSEIMDYYSSVFAKLNEYWSEGMFNSMGHWKIGEEMMWHHFYDKSDIVVKSFGDEFYDAHKAYATAQSYKK